MLSASGSSRTHTGMCIAFPWPLMYKGMQLSAWLADFMLNRSVIMALGGSGGGTCCWVLEMLDCGVTRT